MENQGLLSVFFMSELRTVLVILFWMDLALSVLLLSYVARLGEEGHRDELRRFTLARWLQTVAWGLFILSESKPLGLITLAGSIALVAGLYLETRLLYAITARSTRKRLAVFDALASFGMAVIALSQIVFGARGSYFLFYGMEYCFLLLLPGPIAMLRRRKSPLQIAIGSGYCLLVLLIMLGIAQISFPSIPRAIPGHLIGDLVKILFVEVAMIGGIGFILLSKEDADRRILDLAFRDPLTGLHNRRYFMEEARDVLRDAAREGHEVAMVFMDIDRFKKVNDVHGHHFGDTVLKDFAALLRMDVRPLDRSCRYGGEEFVLLFPNMGRDEVAATVTRILNLVRASRFATHPGFSYTVSAGIFVGKPLSNSVDELQEIIARADSALYDAKGSGRDRLCFFGDAKSP